eukprot:1148158-Pelagomonas_calceolata.AAC.2
MAAAVVDHSFPSNQAINMATFRCAILTLSNVTVSHLLYGTTMAAAMVDHSFPSNQAINMAISRCALKPRDCTFMCIRVCMF